MRRSKAERKRIKNARNRERERKDKLAFRLLAGFAIAFLAFMYLRPLVIGNDIKYNIFIVLLPIAAGILLFYRFRYKLLDEDAVASVKNVWHKIAYVAVFALILSMYSYLTLGLVANIIFDAINYNVASRNKQKEIIVPIDEFAEESKGKRKIYFTFNHNTEYLYTSKENMKVYKAQSHIKKRLKITLREGIWNHYMVEDWEVVK